MDHRESHQHGAAEVRAPHGPPPLGADEATDPVCGMHVDTRHPRGGTAEHDGTTFFFCSDRCRAKFVANPEQYVRGGTKREVEPPPAPLATAYICPMDPDVRQDRPGPCPKCGMALEPEEPSPETRVQYVCPMHPEIVRDAPGSCPICGMALEPRTVLLTDAANPELHDMSRRF